MTRQILIEQHDRWLMLDEERITAHEGRPRPTRTAVALAEFEGAGSHVISLEGSAAHAVALIERRLRADGLVDGEAKILIHSTRTIAAGYQTLFTAFPLETWQQYFAWAEAQPDHCLLVPMPSLMWWRMSPGQGMVLHNGRRLSVLARLKNNIIHASTMAFSEDADDLAMSAGALAQQFADELSRSEDAVESLQLRWCSMLVEEAEPGRPALDEALREIFSARVGVNVESVPHRTVQDSDGRSYRTAAFWLNMRAMPQIAVNPTSTRLAFVAEWVLPLASIASVAFALVLGGIGVRWAMNASQAEARTAQMAAQTREIDDRIAALDTQQQIPDGFQGFQQFLGHAVNLQQAYDPSQALAVVRDAANGQVRVLRVRAEPAQAADPNQPAQPVQASMLRVDAVVDPLIGINGQQISSFVENLRRAGYNPEPIATQGISAAASGQGGHFSYLLRPMAAGANP